MKTKQLLILILPFMCLAVSCKNEFLDAKPRTDILTPQTLDDYRSLLDNVTELYSTPALGHLAADEYQYISDQTWLSTPGAGAKERNSYIWAKDIYEGETSIPDWNAPYKTVFYANNVLNGIEKISKQPLAEYNQIKGWAYFLKAWAYFNLVNTFAKNYDETTAGSDLGIPLRNTADIDQISQRATVEESYNQILSDFKISAGLLPSTFQQANRNRPSKSSAYAAIARVYLCMNKYPEAELYADSSLSIYSQLQDYNTISTTAAIPFSDPNIESLFYSTFSSAYFITKTVATNSTNAIKVDPVLISLYDTNDLRLPIFFAKNTLGNYYKKRTYGGAVGDPFSGLATDEVYLIKAECLARRNQVNLAIDLLNQLLRKRYKNTVPYVPITAVSQQQAVDVVLLERRKELVFRGIRWLDIKRLNKIGAGITLKRTVQGTQYTLEPNDLRYALPIPDDEINLSHLVQNPR